MSNKDYRAKLEAIKHAHKVAIFTAPQRAAERETAREERQRLKRERRRLRAAALLPPKAKKRKKGKPQPTPAEPQPIHPRPPALKRKPLYADYIKSEMWRQVRLWRMEIAGFKCERCGHRDSLEVHHLHYRTLGRERPQDLAVLCDGCHRRNHECLIAAERHMDSIRWEGIE